MEKPRDPRRYARPLRLEHAGAAWHLTTRGNERRNIFQSDADRYVFLDLLGRTAQRFRWKVLSFVLMSNHDHLVIVTPEPTLSPGMHWFNSEYARHYNRKRKRVGHLFQGRFKGILVEQDEHLWEVLRFTVLNPVRAKMVEHPREYRWSSSRALAGLEPAPAWLDASWLLQMSGEMPEAQEAYGRFVEEKIGCTESIWDRVTGQIYFGGEKWIAKMRALVRVVWGGEAAA